MSLHKHTLQLPGAGDNMVHEQFLRLSIGLMFSTKASMKVQEFRLRFAGQQHRTGKQPRLLRLRGPELFFELARLAASCLSLAISTLHISLRRNRRDVCRKQGAKKGERKRAAQLRPLHRTAQFRTHRPEVGCFELMTPSFFLPIRTDVGPRLFPSLSTRQSYREATRLQPPRHIYYARYHTTCQGARMRKTWNHSSLCP